MAENKHHLELTGRDGNRLAADCWGDPRHPTILFLHGGGQTRHAWGGSAARFAATGWYTVALDQRGHGESEWTEQYGTAEYSGDVISVIEQLGAPPVVVGASLGGIAALLAQDAAGGELCRALVLVDIAPRASRTGVERILDFMKSGANGFASIEEAGEAVSNYLRERRRPTDVGGLRKNLRQRADGRWYWHWDPRTIQHTQEERRDAVKLLEGAARRIKIPTLLVRGGKSDVITAEHVKDFQRLVPHAQFVDVGGAGHMVAGDRNDAFTDAIAAFIGELENAVGASEPSR